MSEYTGRICVGGTPYEPTAFVGRESHTTSHTIAALGKLVECWEKRQEATPPLDMDLLLEQMKRDIKITVGADPAILNYVGRKLERAIELFVSDLSSEERLIRVGVLVGECLGCLVASSKPKAPEATPS